MAIKSSYEELWLNPTNYLMLAQNIKNASSQNAIATKTIKAKRKFALTGTPIENSLMELWSIFDFILPGYLHSHNKFVETYEKPMSNQLNEYSIEFKFMQLFQFIRVADEIDHFAYIS